ncbi:MAG: hypothetical protein BRD25_03460, partial [Bacteroidetes bacterium QH_1_61_8]
MAQGGHPGPVAEGFELAVAPQLLFRSEAVGSLNKRVEQVGPNGTDPRHLLKFLDFRVALSEAKHLSFCLGPALEGLIERSVKPSELIGDLRLGEPVQVRFSTFLRVDALSVQIENAPPAKGRLDLIPGAENHYAVWAVGGKKLPPVMYNLPEISESTEKLEELVHKERDAQIQRRFHMLLLLKTGEAKSRSAAARQLGVHRHSVADWLSLYEEG